MDSYLTSLMRLALSAGAFLFIANEARGLALASPILYGMYEAGGTWAALWVGFSSLVGIAMSVLIPLAAAKKLRRTAHH
jgi:fumarate reductase subunit D